MKALLFINGTPPVNLPSAERYSLCACTDGAFHYLKEKNFPLEKLDFISGDFDSYPYEGQVVHNPKFIYTPDQDKTDFQKALEIVVAKGCTAVDVFGGSGGEMDHFLGNLTVGFLFKDKIKLTFFDAFSKYFFVREQVILTGVKGRMISLYPFPETKLVHSEGLNWPLNGMDLSITSRIGTRNYACEDSVKVSFKAGALVIFVGNTPAVTE